MLPADKPSLKDLNQWYKDNEAVMDELRLVNWGKLSYEKKLDIHEDYKKQAKALEELAGKAARSYHAELNTKLYFKKARLNHESGDYRPVWKKVAYFLLHNRFYKTNNKPLLQKLNNLHYNLAFDKARLARES